MFANLDLFSGISGFVVGMLIGALLLGLWYRNRRKREFLQLDDQLELIKKNKFTPVYKENPNPAEQFIQSVFQFSRKAMQRQKRWRKVGKRLNSVLNYLNEGVIVLDDQNHVIFSNESSRELLAITERDLSNRSILEIVRIPEVEQAFTTCLNGQPGVETEFESIRGPKRTLLLKVTQMPKKSKARLMVVLVDISNLRQLENMRRDFVANVSHELKTPLASIKAYSETLRRGAIDDEERRLGFVMTIEEQANRLHQLIFDLIQLAKIEQGKTAFVITDVELTGLVQERVDEFTDNAEKSKINLEFISRESEIWTRADEEGLQTIIDNLLSNAIRYTPANGKVSVVCSKTGEYALLEVVDNGIGIAPDQQERVFERFYRVDKARSREKGGTGLGLSIVKHLTQSMAGKISLNSNVGIGSNFSIYLPLLPESASEQLTVS